MTETNLLFFIFVLSIFNILRILSVFIISLLSNPPKQIRLTDIETLLLGISVSYFITYLFG